MKKENRLLTIDGETLMSQPLTPLNFVVDTLLSQGLHILAGSPKVGKSWLALWLAVTVAKGDPVWGMGVKQGTTLYLCLEDSTLRIQNRLFEITEDAPANVHFSTNSDTLGTPILYLCPGGTTRMPLKAPPSGHFVSKLETGSYSPLFARSRKSPSVSCKDGPFSANSIFTPTPPTQKQYRFCACCINRAMRSSRDSPF